MEFKPVKANLTDIDGISLLLKDYADMGNLLPRTAQDIKKNINEFWVIHDLHNGDTSKQTGSADNSSINSNDKTVIACGALEQFTDELIEIRSLVVNPTIQGSGLGKTLVQELTQAARKRGAKRLMALTYSVGFFEKLGFKVVEKDIFPEKVWSICINCYKFNNCDEVAVVLYL